MAEATLNNSQIRADVLPDAGREQDIFLKGLGDASLSTAFNLTKGFEAGLDTATKVNTFIDEFGPAGQQKKQIALDTSKADLSIKQSAAVVADLKKKSVLENQDLILQTEREKLSREAYQGKLAGQLSQTSSDFYEKLQQIPAGDYGGYAAVRFDPKYAILSRDPEFRKAVRQSDAIYGAAAAQSGTDEGLRISQALVDLDTTSSTSVTLRGQDLKERQLDIQDRSVDVRDRAITARGQGTSAGGKTPALNNEDIGRIQKVTGATTAPDALAAVVSAEVQTRGEGSRAQEVIVMPNGREISSINNPEDFDAIMKAKGFALRTQQGQAQAQPQQAQPGGGVGGATPAPIQPQSPLQPQAQQQPRGQLSAAPAQPAQPTRAVVVPDVQTGLVSTPANVDIVAQRIGVDLPEKSTARKEVSKVLAIVDDLEVDTDGTLLDPNTSVARIPRIKLMKASQEVGKAVASEQLKLVSDEQIAAQMILRDGDTPSQKAIDKERSSREKALAQKTSTELVNIAETARIERQSELRRQQQRLKVVEANSESTLRIAQAKQISVEEVERQVAEASAKMKQNRPELSDEAIRAHILGLIKKKILGS